MNEGLVEKVLNEGLVEKVAIRIAIANNGGTWAQYYTDKQKALWRMRAAEIITQVAAALATQTLVTGSDALQD